MLVRTILNQCHHFKGFVYEKVSFDRSLGTDRLVIEVRPRVGSRGICSGCQKARSAYDRLPVREYEFVPLWGYRVFLRYRMRRVDCESCGVVVEAVPWGSGKRELCKTYMQVLASWCKVLSWQEVSRHFDLSWEKVFSAVDYVVQWGLEHRDLSEITSIGVDEILWHRGHKYLTVVYQLNAGCIRLLWVGKDRSVKTLLRFFRMLGRARTSVLTYVCSDMWKPYLKVIRKKAPQVIHVLDRFHIVSLLNKAIDEVRAQEAREMKQDGYEPLLKHSRWCLLKRQENLSEKQETKLKDLLKYNLKSVRAYLLKEDFQMLWQYVSPSWAGKFIDRWCNRSMRSRIDPMKKVARTIRRHKHLILNWFVARGQLSSAAIEGNNNKIKLTLRKSYGFRTFKCTEIALYHALGKLPEPIPTHRFY